MAQHDNGRRPGGTQAGAWQQGHRDPQQDPSSGPYGGQAGGYDQQGGGSRSQQDQYGQQRHQQGDNWRERQGPSAGGWRPAMEERDRNRNPDNGGHGSFGGQASDNDYGNRGITESGNFGNYGSQGGQRFGGYGHGYDARSDSTGDWNAERAWRDARPTYGQSAADNHQPGRGGQAGPGSQDRYGDNGYQGNFQQGQRGQSYHDPDYHQWRSEQLSRLDRDYDEWRQHRYQRFSEEFDNWRTNRDGNPGAGGGRQGTQAQGDTEGQQAGTSRHEVSGGVDKSAGKTATK